MRWINYDYKGKSYRYSDVRHKGSGRPLASQVLISDTEWTNIRNVDTLDALWNVANGLPFTHDPRKGQ